MADREDSFIARWSRRKRDPAKEPDPSTEPDEADQSQAASPAPQDGAESHGEGDARIDEDAGDPEVIAKLPDIESLDEASDFAPFMAKGVPEVLRRRALRKLWRLNPVFANLDGLNDYDEDFTDAASLLSEIKTVYKVGKGMVDREAAQKTAEETAAAEGAGEPAPAEPQPADSPPEPPVAEQAEAALSAVEAPSDGKDRPGSVAESAPRPEAAGEEGDTVPRKPADPPKRSAAAKRWGESPA